MQIVTVTDQKTGEKHRCIKTEPTDFPLEFMNRFQSCAGFDDPQMQPFYDRWNTLLSRAHA